MINWKLRWKNKTTLLAITTAVIALVYQVLGLLGIAPGRIGIGSYAGGWSCDQYFGNGRYRDRSNHTGRIRF